MNVLPYSDDLAEEALRFFRDAGAGDTDVQPPSEDEWRVFTGRSFNHGASDFALFQEKGKTVAILMSARLPKPGRDVRNFRIIVHPDHRRGGLASEVLRHVEGQDPENDTTLQAECMRSWVAGTGFLRSRGFEVDREEFWMHHGSLPSSPPPLPDLRLVAHDNSPEQREAWKRLTEEAYSGTVDATELTDEDLDVLPTEPGFRLLFLVDGAEMVGLCHVKEYAQRLYVNSLAVTGSHRGRGLGRLVLLGMMARVREEGVEEMRLTVRSDNLPALRIYESVGFVTEDVSAKWCRRRD